MRFEAPSGAWEQRVGCVYSHSTTTLSRGTLVDSSSGAAISLAAGDLASNDAHAGWARRLDSQANPRRYSRWLAIGTSITNMWGDAGVASYSRQINANSYLFWLMVALQGRARSIINRGVSGNTSTQMLARFASDVEAVYDSFDTLILEPGPNDYPAGLTEATIRSNIATMVSAALRAGKDVVLLTPTITEAMTSAQGAILLAVRKWIYDTFALDRGVLLVDAASLLSDPLTGTPAAEMYLPTTTEPYRTHLSIAGACVLARAIAAAIGDGPKVQALTPIGGRDPNELIPNARCGGTNASGSRNFFAGPGVNVAGGGPDSTEIGISRGSFASVSISPVTPSGAGAPGAGGTRITIGGAATDRSTVSIRFGSSDGVLGGTQYGRWDTSFSGGAAFGYGSHALIGGSGILTCIAPGVVGGSAPTAPSSYGEVVTSGGATFFWQKLPAGGDVVVPELEYEIESLSGSVALVVQGALCRNPDATAEETFGWSTAGYFDQAASLVNGPPTKWLPRVGVITGLPITLQGLGISLRHVFVGLDVVCMAGCSATIVIKRAGLRLQ